MDDQIVVVGGGTMGAGIAVVAARAGYAVTLVEPDATARERAQERVARAAERTGDRTIGERISLIEAVPQSATVMLAIEAVPERLELKSAVFTDLEDRLPGAVLATNTSSLSVAEIADAAAEPARVVGMHFFNPPEAMALVEIVGAPGTGEEALERARAFVERIGKTGIVTADTPGFVVNRVARPFYLQSMRAFEAGTAPIEELDALARGVGFRMGPFELMDLIGLDVNLATSESIYARTGQARFEPVETQYALVAQGRLGRKSGAGFYAYDTPPPRLDLACTPKEMPDHHERIAIVGTGGLADDLAAALEEHFAPVQRIESEELLDQLVPDTTIVIDLGDGSSSRNTVIERLDAQLPVECVIFSDAYATDISHCGQRLAHPERLVGFGILGSLDRQRGVEIVDSDGASDDALALAKEMFEAIGRGVVLVADTPGLFLGRVVGSIINEAVTAVEEGVASAENVDTAMRLGTNYPLGPIEWGREIGGARVTRILKRLAQTEGEAFGPNRALWVLDLEDETQPFTPDPYGYDSVIPLSQNSVQTETVGPEAE